ncbi:hypothetical protein U1E44_16775 [Arenibacter sp. GZD96]|nr:hypothetical protein [Arenibacter sp. GZD-96]MEA1787753.1 hypothetical protein [Arenibacter sp. GZD-96]
MQSRIDIVRTRVIYGLSSFLAAAQRFGYEQLGISYPNFSV